MRVNLSPAAGPDHIPGPVLRTWTHQLADDMFKVSLSQERVPICFKTAATVPEIKRSTVYSNQSILSPLLSTQSSLPLKITTPTPECRVLSSARSWKWFHLETQLYFHKKTPGGHIGDVGERRSLKEPEGVRRLQKDQRQKTATAWSTSGKRYRRTGWRTSVFVCVCVCVIVCVFVMEQNVSGQQVRVSIRGLVVESLSRCLLEKHKIEHRY